MEHSVKSEYYPPVKLEDIGTVSIHLATLNEEAFVEPTLQTLVSQKVNNSSLKRGAFHGGGGMLAPQVVY